MINQTKKKYYKQKITKQELTENGVTIPIMTLTGTVQIATLLTGSVSFGRMDDWKLLTVASFL